MKSILAGVLLASTSRAVEAELGVEFKSQETLNQEIVQQCLDNYSVALAELIPGDFPKKALHDMTVNVCLKQADSVPSKYCVFSDPLSYCDRRTTRNSMCVPVTILTDQLQTIGQRLGCITETVRW